MLITQHEKNLLKHKKSIILLLLIPALIYFWPASLYGDSDYIILVGNSMLPTMEPGSLVFVKKQPQYEISEIVAFTDSTGKHIVHRIIENSDERIVTQGDNNSYLDSPITQNDIVGRAEFVIPYMGYVSLFLKTPIGLSMFAIIMVFMIIPKSKSKTKLKSKKQKEQENDFGILKAALIITAIHYVIEQIAIAMNMQVVIPLLNNLETSIASTLEFGMWVAIFGGLYVTVKKAELLKIKSMKSLKMGIIGFCLMMIFLKLTSIIPFITNFLGID